LSRRRATSVALPFIRATPCYIDHPTTMTNISTQKATSTTTSPACKESTTRRVGQWPLAAAAAAALLAARARTLLQPSLLVATPPLVMSADERSHVLREFFAGAPPRTNTTVKDTVWARRTYAPMHIHAPELAAYKQKIAAAFPEHAITFDVVFAAAANSVPWHADFDSLGPFDASLASIPGEEFITVHANLIEAEGGPEAGRLQTLDSPFVAALHYASNRLTNSFGSLGDLFAPLHRGATTHPGAAGVGNAFNNLKAHAVTAGKGRVSYVVRLVRKDVRLSRDKVRAAAVGEASTRAIKEFERFLPLFGEEEELDVGDFEWSRVSRTTE